MIDVRNQRTSGVRQEVLIPGISDDGIFRMALLDQG